MHKALKNYFAICKRNPKEIWFGFFATFFSGFGQTFFISFMIPNLQEAYLLNSSKIGIMFGILTLACAFFMPKIGKIVDTTNLRLYSISVFLIYGVSLIVLSLTPHIGILFVILFLVRLIGQGLLSQLATTSIMEVMSLFCSERK